MHGQNKLRPREGNGGQLLQVQDIWYTIQGEGPFFGLPAVFIRLTGCNLACTFCDTKWDDNNDKYEPVETIISRAHGKAIQAYGYCELAVITGGEPARQDLGPLLEGLTALGMKVQIETAGTYWQDCFLLSGVYLVCSPKTKHVHPKIKEHCVHWKYVIQAGKTNIYDGLPAGCTQHIPVELIKKTIAPDLYKDAVEKYPHLIANAPEQTPGLFTLVTGGERFGDPCRPPVNKDNTIWLSPCNEGNPEANRRNMVLVGQLCMKFGYRAQVQLHNLLELP